MQAFLCFHFTFPLFKNFPLISTWLCFLNFRIEPSFLSCLTPPVPPVGVGLAMKKEKPIWNISISFHSANSSTKSSYVEEDGRWYVVTVKVGIERKGSSETGGGFPVRFPWHFLNPSSRSAGISVYLLSFSHLRVASSSLLSLFFSRIAKHLFRCEYLYNELFTFFLHRREDILSYLGPFLYFFLVGERERKLLKFSNELFLKKRANNTKDLIMTCDYRR